MYLNGQYLHGFVQERGASNLEDYFVFALDWKLLDDKLTISPLGVVVEIKNWKDIPNNYGILAAPSVSFVPVDNAQLTIGLHLIQGLYVSLHDLRRAQREQRGVPPGSLQLLGAHVEADQERGEGRSSAGKPEGFPDERVGRQLGADGDDARDAEGLPFPFPARERGWGGRMR